MIKPECFSRQWCEQVAQRLNYNDTQLIEKVVRALSLLEMLVQRMPVSFQGRNGNYVAVGRFHQQAEY